MDKTGLDFGSLEPKSRGKIYGSGWTRASDQAIMSRIPVEIVNQWKISILGVHKSKRREDSIH